VSCTSWIKRWMRLNAGLDEAKKRKVSAVARNRTCVTEHSANVLIYPDVK
jgi:hypothetical protein